MDRLECFPIFIGSDRSGTTLFRVIFDSHPELAIPYESWFLVPLLRQRHRYEGPAGIDHGAFIRDLSEHPRFQAWQLPVEVVERRLIANKPHSAADALRSVFAAYAAEQGKARYGDKTPSYVRHLALLADQFPEALFIHVIRDGRDVALSLKEVEWGPSTIEDAAFVWKRRVEMGRRVGAGLGHRYMEVRYEDLLDEPPKVIRRICDRIGLGFDQRMLDYTARSEAAVAAAKFPHRHENLVLPPTKGLRDWRQVMSKDQLQTFEALAGTLLEKLGYERAVPRVPASMRLAARRKELVEEFKRKGPGGALNTVRSWSRRTV